MSETPISLSKYRKTKMRRAERKQADANAVNFGRPKHERHSQRLVRDKEIKQLDQHRRESSSHDERDKED